MIQFLDQSSKSRDNLQVSAKLAVREAEVCGHNHPSWVSAVHHAVWEDGTHGLQVLHGGAARIDELPLHPAFVHPRRQVRALRRGRLEVRAIVPSTTTSPRGRRLRSARPPHPQRGPARRTADSRLMRESQRLHAD